MVLLVSTSADVVVNKDSYPVRTDNKPRTAVEACNIVCLRLYTYKKILLDTLDDAEDEILTEIIEAEFAECFGKCKEMWN